MQEFGERGGRAKQAIRTIRRNIEGCYGTIREPRIDGIFIRRPADVPALGDGRPVAWKMNDHWRQGRDGLQRIYYSRRIWMREGETVIGVDLWGDVPQSRDAVDPARRAGARDRRLSAYGAPRPASARRTTDLAWRA